MKIVFMGTPDFAAAELAALIDHGYDVAAVFTKEDKPVGRGKKLTASPVKELAVSDGIPVYQPHSVKNGESYEILKELSPDIIVVAAYGQIIPQRILDLPRFGCINVHASLLPAWRGAAPIQWSVISGDRESGVTIMQMSAGLDTGDMIAKRTVELAADETGGSLFDRLSRAGAELLIETLPKIEAGEIHPEKQPEESTTPYARMIRKSDGLIDWTIDAASIERLIRGLNPWPSAYSFLGGRQVKFWKAAVLEKESGREPGTVFDVDKKGFSVQTGAGSLRIGELQMTGKKRMTADAFLRGHALADGERFTDGT